MVTCIILCHGVNNWLDNLRIVIKSRPCHFLERFARIPYLQLQTEFASTIFLCFCF